MLDNTNSTETYEEEESRLDPNHNVEEYTAVLVRGFEQELANTIKASDEIYEKYSRQAMPVIQIGLEQLNVLGERIGDFVMQTTNGNWPDCVLPILAKAMGYLTSMAAKLKASAKPFSVVDLTDCAPAMPLAAAVN